VATVVPFVAGGFAMTGAAPALSLQAVVVLLAGIHVPMTVYLLFDPAIRKMMRDRPVALIVAPLLIFAAIFAVNYLTTEARRAPQPATSILCISWSRGISGTSENRTSGSIRFSGHRKISRQ
jgi:hypothetical protein